MYSIRPAKNRRSAASGWPGCQPKDTGASVPYSTRFDPSAFTAASTNSGLSATQEFSTYTLGNRAAMAMESIIG